MKTRYEINPVKKDTIAKLNLIKDYLKIKTSGEILEFLVDEYLKEHQDKIKQNLFKLIG